MFVKVSADGSVSLEDRDNFRAFKLVVEGGPKRLEQARRALASTAELPDQTHRLDLRAGAAAAARGRAGRDVARQSRHDDREGQAARLDRRAEEGDQGAHRVDREALTLTHGHRRSHRRRRPGRADARRRSRPARRALHADRAEKRAAHVAEDGALQRAHHGNLSPHGPRRENPRRRAAGARCRWTCSSSRSLVEPPLLHLPYPSVDEAKKQIAACHDGTLPLEPYQLISQYTLEPLLKSVAETLPSVTVRYGCEFVSFAQDAACRHRARSTKAAGPRAITAQYLVGCDGGTSVVRKQLGIKLAGEGNILQLRQALYRCDELFERIADRQGPPLPRRRQPGDAAHRAGLDPALHAAFGGREGRGHGGDVREDRRHAGEIRDALCRRVAAEPAARRPLHATAACSSPATRCIW